MSLDKADIEQAIAQFQSIRQIKQSTVRQLLIASNGLLDTLDATDLSSLPEHSQQELEQKMTELTTAIAVLIAQIA